MSWKGVKISCAVLLALSLANETHAQSRAVGASFSYAGVGLVYEYDVSEDTFAEIQFRAEMSEVFRSMAPFPGVTASWTWNMYFAQVRSGNGNGIRFFAGPGVIAGFTPDMRAPYGALFGLKGRIGGECRFERNVSISVSISPVLGAHVSMRDGMPHMKLYRNGLPYGAMPEIGIKYMF